MKYVTDLILPAQASPAASGTFTLPIRTKNVISRIEMTYKTTKATAGMAAPAPANIPKIELVDGSTPLHSLTGYTNQALAYYSRGKVAMEHGQHIEPLSEVDIYAMDFGRYLWDPVLAFDPTKFANPQLKIQWNRAVADTSVSVDSMEIWAEEFDEKKPSPMGFLSARELWSGAFLANDSVNEVLIPDDEVIRQILVRAHYDGYEPWYQIDSAKLDESGNGKVVFDFPDLEQYYRRMKSRWPMLDIPLAINTDTSVRYFYLAPSDFYATALLTANIANAYYYTVGHAAKGGKLGIIGSAGTQAVGKATGYLPWSTFQFPMGKQDDPEDWYDATGKGPRLRMNSNTAGASGDGNVVIETIHRY